MKEKEGSITLEDGIRLYFRQIGDGSETVLIPNGMYLLDDFKQFAGSRSLIFYDVRNRGLSDAVTGNPKLARGIHQDVEDLEAVRRHFKIQRPDLIGHSYIGLMIGLYALKFPDHVNRLVQICPTQPDAGAQYPPHLTGADETLKQVFARLGQMQKEKRPDDPVEACNQFWSVLRLIYVVNPAHAEKINWGRCDLTNERNFMKYWTESIYPSLQNIHLTAEQFSNVKTPVLIIHGNRDRSAPYGGGRDWALAWPNARLLTVTDSAHAPWIESSEVVFSAIRDFLDGRWPANTEKVQSLEP